MLQQVTTFIPFMRKPIVLASITGRASNHDVPFVVTTSFAGDWHNVVNFIILAQLYRAIVALTLLPFELVKNILSGEHSWKGLLECFSITRSHPILRLKLFTLTCCSIAPFASHSQMVRLARIGCKVLTGCRQGRFACAAHLHRAIRRVCSFWSTFMDFLNACIAGANKPVFLLFAIGKVLMSGWKHVLALPTPLKALWKSMATAQIETVFTSIDQFIFSMRTCIVVKVVSHCRQITLADGTSLHSLWRAFNWQPLTLFASRGQVISTSLIGIEKFECGGEFPLALEAAFASLCDRNVLLFLTVHRLSMCAAFGARLLQFLAGAWLTAWRQGIFRLLVGMEVVECSGEGLVTGAARLERNLSRIHRLNSPSFSRLSLAVARAVGVPLLSQGLITPLLGNHHSIAFFPAPVKAEGGMR